MPPKKKEDKVEQLKGIDAEKKLHEYLKEQNRPHGVADITANIKVIKKADVLKGLVTLEEAGIIVSKTFAKQQVYCIKQEDGTAASPEELKELQAKVEEAKAEATKLREKTKALNVALSALLAEPAEESIGPMLKTLDSEVQNRKKRLADLQSSGSEASSSPAPTADELKIVDDEYKKYRGLWLDRRKICKEIIGVLTEPMDDKSAREAFVENLGIEGDTEELVELEKQELARVHEGTQRGKKRKLA